MKSSSSTIKRASRALALILSLMLMLTMTTVPALAADGGTTVAATDPSLFDYYDNGDGTIYIEGYNGDDKDTMTELVIPEEIDGESVTVIGWNAFEGCTSLTSVTIPESVTYIGEKAFYGCPNLKSVTIPASVTSIGDNAFGYYEDEETWDDIKVEGFTITGYKNSAAYRYAMENGFEFVSLGEVSPFTYGEISGTIAITGYNGYEAQINIPAKIDGKKVTGIGSSAFENCTSLESVTIPESVADIYYDAFYNCPNLKTVTIPASVTSIDNEAFGYCSRYWDENDNYIDGKVDGFTITGYKNSAAYAYARDNGFEFVSLGEVSPFVYDELDDGTIEITHYYGNKEELTKLDIPAKIEGKKVTRIGTAAFSSCTSLTSVTIPESVTDIYDYAFSNCTSLTSVTIPESVTGIYDHAFYRCPNLKEVTIPASVTSIYNKAFGYYRDEETWEDIKSDGFTITGYKNSAAYAYARDNEFDFTSLGEIDPFDYRELENGTLELIAYYGDKEGLTKLDIPAEIDGKSVTEIGYNAFENCTSLESVTIPDGVTEIGYNAFGNCTSLTSVTIPESVTYIGGNAFDNCPNLKSVTIPKSIVSIGNNAFGYYEDQETWEDIKVDGFKITGYKNSAAYAYARDNEFDFTSLGEVDPLAYEELEDGTLELVAYYGDDRETMTKLDIPAKVNGKSVAKIGLSAFEGCKSLTSVNIPESMIVIGWSAFKNCTSLTSVTIPKSVINIGRGAFGYYDNEEVGDYNIKVDGFAITGYTNSAAYAYARDNEFEFVSLGATDNPFGGTNPIDGTIMMSDYFGDKDKLTELSIPAELGGKSVTSIMYNTFEGCTSLKSVSTPSSLKSIGFNSFAGCEALENVNLSAGLTTIEDDAFYNCSSLKKITIPESVTLIGDNAFGYKNNHWDGKIGDYVYEKIDGFTIKGYAGTEAERYAKDNGFNFVALEEKKSGDIDGSGAVDAKDRMTITRYIAKWKGYESIDKTAADVNSDGEVDAADRMIITRHIAKWKGYETLPFAAAKQ